MYHKYDNLSTDLRALVNRYKYGSYRVTRKDIIAWLRNTADKLEREQRKEDNLDQQGSMTDE